MGTYSSHDLALACAEQLDRLAELARRRGDLTLAMRYMAEADRNRAYAQHHRAPVRVRLAELDQAVALARLVTPWQALVQ